MHEPIDRETEPLIRVEGLRVAFEKQMVLRGIDLDVYRGETVAVIGESGCGKTVLLKTIVGLIVPSAGRVVFDGKVIHELSERERTRQRLRFGFVFQGAALFDSLDIYENIAFPLREHTKKSDTEIAETVRDRLLEVGLSTDIAPRKPAELSGGMRKRVGFARAVALDPEVMLYDEPTTGLDPIMSDVVNELLLQARRRRPVTSIVVTHDMKTATKVADRIVMLYPDYLLKGNEPQILYDGPPGRIDQAADPRVRQFVHGEAGERLIEMAHRAPKREGDEAP